MSHQMEELYNEQVDTQNLTKLVGKLRARIRELEQILEYARIQGWYDNGRRN